jgi:hypothetical protein
MASVLNGWCPNHAELVSGEIGLAKEQNMCMIVITMSTVITQMLIV